MITPEEKDYIGEVLREDEVARRGISANPLGVMAKRARIPLVPLADYDALRQQLADVSHERDVLRADRDRIKSLFAALETDAALLDYLQDQLVDIIYLDDGRIIDIAGRVTLREGVRAHMSTPTPPSAEVQS